MTSSRKSTRQTRPRPTSKWASFASPPANMRRHSRLRRDAPPRVADVHDSGGASLPRTGFIDHIGIGVPDLVATKRYYDDLMSVLGLRQWFPTVPGGPLNYGPDGDRGSQLFFYQADEPGTYSRGQTGFH